MNVSAACRKSQHWRCYGRAGIGSRYECECEHHGREPEIDDEPPPDVGTHAGAIIREYEGTEDADL